MKKLFTSWILSRYIFASITAFIGFILIFKNGINSGGRVLLIMSLIALASTILFEFIGKRQKGK